MTPSKQKKRESRRKKWKADPWRSFFKLKVKTCFERYSQNFSPLQPSIIESKTSQHKRFTKEVIEGNASYYKRSVRFLNINIVAKHECLSKIVSGHLLREEEVWRHLGRKREAKNESKVDPDLRLTSSLWLCDRITPVCLDQHSDQRHQRSVQIAIIYALNGTFIFFKIAHSFFGSFIGS